MNFFWKLAGIIIPAIVAALIFLLCKRLRGREIAFELFGKAMFQYVTDAERGYGDGTGPLKLAAVIDWAAAFLSRYNITLDTDKLIEIVERELRAAKDRWKENPAFLGASFHTNAVGFVIPDAHTAEDGDE